MRWAWFALAVAVVLLVVAAGLYAAGPKSRVEVYHPKERECAAYSFLTPGECIAWRDIYPRRERTRRTNAWARITGAITGS
jgi:hypothetical protein